MLSRAYHPPPHRFAFKKLRVISSTLDDSSFIRGVNGVKPTSPLVTPEEVRAGLLLALTLNFAPRSGSAKAR
jgi:hypothetical protein